MRERAVPRLDGHVLPLGRPAFDYLGGRRRPGSVVLRDLGRQQLRTREVAAHAEKRVDRRIGVRRSERRLPGDAVEGE